MFTRLEVIVLTNKQTHKQTSLKTSNALRYATTSDNHVSCSDRFLVIDHADLDYTVYYRFRFRFRFISIVVQRLKITEHYTSAEAVSMLTAENERKINTINL